MDQEVWKNATKSQIVLLRNGGPGGAPRHEMITGERTFSISPDERRMNQNMAANPELDVFCNGMLQPVQLLEETEPEMTENPNHIPDDQLPRFFKLHYRTFDKRVQEISNPIVLQRLIEIGPDQDATVRQIELVQTRLREVSPGVGPRDMDEEGMPKIKPVTPR